ncbi:GNAT family N-acetyltransferase [Ammoniphilus sp. YIM 78166]|uniref:GNAT family N-acetyltransferase n=1 Tax=Ammoniphilus sp. YIM 78166 TaxID=1644106 RepID=UPI00106F34DE|nr:GNAT family N-acetyltransferase [Ammoniphilus sp. YIM 78166]
MGIWLKKLETLMEFQHMADLERRVWGMDPLPYHQTLTAAKNGGIVIGAFDQDQLVGFVYSFPGYANREAYLCSHMMGIDPGYRNQGIGYRLKMKQAEEAQKMGYKRIRWTYDPLESRNGYLNIAKLGAICSDYIENCYGEMNDELNKALPSDRFNVEWWIDHPHALQRKDKLSVQADGLLLDWSLRSDGLPQAICKEVDSNPSTILFVPVPEGFQQLKQRDSDLAIEWRLKTRKVFRQHFAEGWAVAHVLRQPEEPVQYYVLVKRESLALE